VARALLGAAVLLAGVWLVGHERWKTAAFALTLGTGITILASS
jgi:hypothetical protein